MTTLEKVAEEIQNYTMSNLRARHMLLAYLMLHRENRGLHPDDAVSEQGGYEGWHAILTYEVLTKNPDAPDMFVYPNAILKLDAVLEELHAFHEDLYNDSIEDNEHEQTMLSYINSIMMFLEEMKPSELAEVIDCLQALYLYHANENDTAEEESEKPAGILRESLDTFIWISQQN